jgi:hypothetical protein
MFRRKKKTQYNVMNQIDKYFGISDLKLRVTQLECTHVFKFKECIERHLPNLFGTGYGLVYECPCCGKTKNRYWRYLNRKEQQALKTLDLVPEDWKVKEDTDDNR